MSRGYIAALITLLVIAVFSSPVMAMINVGDKAPDFKLDIINGKGSIRLSDYTNKPTLLVFWASWCSHCQREMPVITRIYKSFKDKGLNVIGISVDDSITNARRFTGQYSPGFPNVYAGTDRGMDMVKTYGVTGVPTVYILNKGGIVKARYTGEVDETTIKNNLASVGVK